MVDIKYYEIAATLLQTSTGQHYNPNDIAYSVAALAEALSREHAKQGALTENSPKPTTI